MSKISILSRKNNNTYKKGTVGSFFSLPDDDYPYKINNIKVFTDFILDGSFFLEIEKHDKECNQHESGAKTNLISQHTYNAILLNQTWISSSQEDYSFQITIDLSNEGLTIENKNIVILPQINIKSVESPTKILFQLDLTK